MHVSICVHPSGVIYMRMGEHYAERLLEEIFRCLAQTANAHARVDEEFKFIS